MEVCDTGGWWSLKQSPLVPLSAGSLVTGFWRSACSLPKVAIAGLTRSNKQAKLYSFMARFLFFIFLGSLRGIFLGVYFVHLAMQGHALASASHCTAGPNMT